MLEIRKTAITLNEEELLQLERIVTDREAEQALSFLKKQVYDRIVQSQQGRLKSHLDGVSDPAALFNESSK